MKNSSIITENPSEIFSERFNQIDDFFSKLTGKYPIKNFPYYNIKKIDNEYYEISISVPGYNKEDIEIGLKSGQIFIKGRILDKEKNNNNYIYKGINIRNFNLSFTIGNKSKIKNAILKNGILYISIIIEIPEEDKLQKIEIHD